MMRKLTGSLLFRLTILVVLVVLTTQFFTLWLAAAERHRLLDKQLYSQVVDTLAFLEGSMEDLSKLERQEFLASYNRPGLPRLLPFSSSSGVVFEESIPRLGQTLATRLSHALNETVVVRMAHTEDRRELWIPVHVLGEPYWLVIPFGRYVDRPINTVMQAAIMAALVATILASLLAWRVTRPISQVVSATRQLADGIMPAPVDPSGPREVQELASGFNSMTRALQAAAKERSLMMAGLSHDLRTPLTRLKLMLEMQDDGPDKEDMLSDIDELSGIVRQFIDFVRAEESTRCEPVALGELAANMVARFMRDGLRVELKRFTEPELQADALALERLVSNLLENARRYGVQPVIVEVDSDDEHAWLSVIDHGPGIPPELREKALAPFERLAAHRGTDGGSGLGLAIVSRIVKQHQGELAFVDDDDGGFRIRIRFPLTPPEAHNG